MPRDSGSPAWTVALRRAWRRLFGGNRLEADFQAQLQEHIEHRTSEFLAAGLSQSEARAAALRRIGNVTQIRESLHEEVRSARLEAIGRDIRLGFRTFRRAPRFALAVVVTVALTVGVNIAAFAALRSVVLGDQPFPHADRIVQVWQTGTGVAPQGSDSEDMAVLRGVSVFDAVGAVEEVSAIVRGQAAPEYLTVGHVTAGFFEIFASPAGMGRVLTPADFDGRSQVAVIADSIWTSQFGRASDVVGRPIRVGDAMMTVVGVMPARFDAAFPDSFLATVWVPDVVTNSSRALEPFARLSPGSSAESAERFVRDAMRPRQQQLAPMVFPGGRVISIDGVLLERLGQRDVLAAQPGLVAVQVMAVLLLVIAAANLANLFLARTFSRRREIGTRAALGAGRTRVARQLVIEGIVLATVGGLAGMLLAFWALPALAGGSVLPRASNPGVGMFEVSLGLCSAWLMALLFAGVPTYVLTRRDPLLLMRDQTKGLSGRPCVAQWLLVAAQVTLSVVVLVAAGLLVRSFMRVMAEPLGFQPDGLVIAELRLPASKAGADDRRNLIMRTEAALTEQLNGQAWAIGSMPFSSAISTTNWTLGSGDFQWEQSVTEEIRSVSGNYFATLGIATVRGRPFGPTDSASSQSVAVVNEEFVRKYGRSRELIGSVLREQKQDYVIVGVVSDVRVSRLTRKPSRAIYTLLDQSPSSRFAVAVRSSDVAAVSAVVGRVAQTLGPDVVVTRVATGAERISRSESRRRFYTVVLSGFGVLALALSAVGIFGVTATSMAFRTRELAVRLALGGSPRRVKLEVLRAGLVPVASGLAAGLLLTWWIAKAVASTPAVQGQLYETSVHDPGALVLTAVILLTFGAIACWLPARRADAINPSGILKSE